MSLKHADAVLTPNIAHRFNHFHQQPRPVLDRAAMAVSALVAAGIDELIEEIVIGSVDPQKATIRRTGGDGAMSTRLVWTLAAARRRKTDQSRGTIKFAASGRIATVLQHPRWLERNDRIDTSCLRSHH
jgi:hypothetical protein